MSYCPECSGDISYVSCALLIYAVPLGSGINHPFFGLNVPLCAQGNVDVSYVSWTLLIYVLPLGNDINNPTFCVECPTVRNVSLTFRIFFELCWSTLCHWQVALYRISCFWIECPAVRNVSLTFHAFLELCWNARAHGDLLSLALTFPGLLWLSWNARAHGVLWLYLSCFDLAGALVCKSWRFQFFLVRWACFMLTAHVSMWTEHGQGKSLGCPDTQNFTTVESNHGQVMDKTTHVIDKTGRFIDSISASEDRHLHIIAHTCRFWCVMLAIAWVARTLAALSPSTVPRTGKTVAPSDTSEEQITIHLKDWQWKKVDTLKWSWCKTTYTGRRPTIPTVIVIWNRQQMLGWFQAPSTQICSRPVQVCTSNSTILILKESDRISRFQHQDYQLHVWFVWTLKVDELTDSFLLWHVWNS